MSKQSNNQGRAYEYICLLTLSNEINRFRTAEIERNSAYHAAYHAWTDVDMALQETLKESARAAVATVFDMEPMIIEQGDDVLSLKIQTDQEGKAGDVRDIVISRKEIKWEIGLSLKHNHFAVKHNRLAKTLDFGAKWYGIPCSKEYWDRVQPIFQRLEREKLLRRAWRELKDKDTEIYVPLLRAFIEEVKKSNAMDPSVPKKMAEYLLGEFDFYKIISVDSKRLTQIQTYNMHGKLNRPAQTRKPKIVVPVTSLPTRIVSLDFKPNSTTTAELYMDGGWEFGFRLHNAATMAEPSVKFDIQVIGMPATIISINCIWQ